MWIVWWFILIILVMILRAILKEPKVITVISNRFKRHLNSTWLFFYILTLIVAFSYIVYEVQHPPTTVAATPGHWVSFRVPGTNMVEPKLIGATTAIVVDEKALKERNLADAIIWFWPIYLIGTFKVSKWALKQKGRDLNWLWLTLLLFPITPLVLSNKCVKSVEP